MKELLQDRRGIWLSILLIVTLMIPPLYFIVPYPILLLMLLYSVKRALLYLLIPTVVVGIISLPYLFSLVLIASIAFIIYYQVKKQIAPRQMIYQYASFVLIFIAVGTAIFFIARPSTELLKSNISQTLEKSNLLGEIGNHGQVATLVDQILSILPSALFFLFFLIYTFNLFLILKSRHWWKEVLPYPHTLHDLKNFTTPGWLIYLVLLNLILFIFDKTNTLAINLYQILAPFYFLHGLSVTRCLYRYFKIPELISFITLFLIIMIKWQLIALLGVLDFWIDSRIRFKERSI